MTERWRVLTCFSGYLTLVSWFVLTIRHQSDCLPRYCLLAWAHLATFFIVGAGHLLNLTLHHGIIWYIFSMSIITINDIAAYMCGFFFGSTPLIVLSPKKTVEGFIGGGLITVSVAPMYANFLQQLSSITCPVGDDLTVLPCTTSQFYRGTDSHFVFHCLVISLFARSALDLNYFNHCLFLVLLVLLPDFSAVASNEPASLKTLAVLFLAMEESWTDVTVCSSWLFSLTSI